MKVKIKSFEEIARYVVGMPPNIFKKECDGFTLDNLLSIAYTFDSKEKNVSECLTSFDIKCYKDLGDWGFTFPRFFVEKELPAEPDKAAHSVFGKDEPETTADSIREMQYKIKPDSVNAQSTKSLI